MKLKTLALSLAVAGAASVSMVPAAANAGVSANAGVFTDYVWRGADQTTNNSVALQGGLDYENDNGVFAGVWASTLDTGYEYDLYAGWGGTFGSVDLGVAYSMYRFTDNTAGDTEEVNLSAGFGPISVGYDVDVKNSASTYKHYSVAADLGVVAEGMSLAYGLVSPGGATADSGYWDLGYSASIDKGVDLGINYTSSATETNFVVGLSKSFDLM